MKWRNGILVAKTIEEKLASMREKKELNKNV